jgi:hypothetical protein
LKPISPVVAGFERYERVYGADQSEYLPLPALPAGGELGLVISRWRLTWKERLRVLVFGDVYVRQMTFGQSLQPVMVHVGPPRVDGVAEASEPDRAGKRILRPATGDVLRFGRKGGEAGVQKIKGDLSLVAGHSPRPDGERRP